MTDETRRDPQTIIDGLFPVHPDVQLVLHQDQTLYVVAAILGGTQQHARDIWKSNPNLFTAITSILAKALSFNSNLSSSHDQVVENVIGWWYRMHPQLNMTPSEYQRAPVDDASLTDDALMKAARHTVIEIVVPSIMTASPGTLLRWLHGQG